MAFTLTQTTKNLSSKLPVEPVIILEIDGIPLSFGTDVITRKWLFDEGQLFDDGLLFDGVVSDENSRGYIQSNGTTTNLTSQVEIEEGGVGSVQKFNVNLVDQDGEVSTALTPGVNVEDPISRVANVYLGFKGGAHPIDSVRIFTGVVTSIKSGAGSISVGISHPDELKRQEIFQDNTAKLAGAIDASVTTIPFDEETFEFNTPQDVLLTYFTIEEEIIQYTGISGGSFTGCTRGVLNTVATSHDDDTEIKSFYSISGNPVDLALKIMMSNRDESIASGDVKNFNQVTPSEYQQNGIFIEDNRFLDDNGLEGGELVTIIGATNPANNVTDVAILNATVSGSGVILILDSTLIDETDSSATITIKSQYNVLPDGLGMSHSQVDVKQHQELLELYGNQLPEYLFYLKEAINGKSFLAEQVYFPAGLYSLIRKARSSVQFTAPPLDTGLLATLDSSNVLNPDTIQPERSTSKYFYNNITYRYNEDSVEDKFLTGSILLSARSSNRIKLGNKVLKIDSKGLRDTPDATQFVVRQSRRFTERFQFVAEKIVVDTNFKTGFNIEVGDATLFGDTGLQIYDSTTGTRDFKPRLMEVINKSFSLLGAKITLTLLDTQFSSDARYGTVSPNSFIDTGSTTTSIKIKKSFTTGVFDIERDKWTSLIGESILIRSEDFAFSEVVTLISFEPSDETKINVSPALSVVPSEDYLVDVPRYNEGTDKVKSIHCFASPQVAVLSGVSTTEFVVNNADIDKFFVGSFVRIHNESFSVDSTPTLDKDDLEITAIVGDNITVNRDMGFTPSSSELVSLIGFSSDEGLPYRFA